MTTTDIFAFFAALFSMMNPIGGVGIFASLTANRTEEESKKIAKTSAFASAITLLVVIWAGGGFLQLFGITVNEIRVAGGLIILLIGLHMLFNKDDHRTSSAETTVHSNHESIAVVPLAIPLLAGPGTMATVIVASQNHHGVSSDFILSLVVIIVSAITGVLFTYSRIVANYLGESGMAIVSRVMGMILMAIAVGMLAEGLRAMFPVLR